MWRDGMPGLNTNNVFPIRIVLSGHGEMAAFQLLRAPSPNQPKGPVASTCCWGDPPTITNNAVWLEMVNGILNWDLSLGWARVLAITAAENYFPDFQVDVRQGPGGGGRVSVYDHIKSDIDMYGDPGLVSWKGVPKVVRTTFPATVSPTMRCFEVSVRDTTNQFSIPDALVTVYAPGTMPAFNNANYATFTDMQSWTQRTGADGIARFVFGDGVQLTTNTKLYVTVTGRGILPSFGEADIEQQETAVELSGWRFEEVQGDQNGEINPGESIRLFVTATNTGRADMNDVIATVTSLSDFVQVEGNEAIELGNILTGAFNEGDEGVILQVTAFCPDGLSNPNLRPVIKVDFTSNDQTWSSAFRLDASAPNLTGIRVVGDGIIPPNELTNLSLSMSNTGRRASPVTSARLLALGPGVVVQRDSSSFPEIRAGGVSDLQGDPFVVIGNPRMVPGSKTAMALMLNSADGVIDTLNFDLQVGQSEANAPQGPDNYGYNCFDDTDSEWDIAPVYEWVEIDPDANNPDFEGSRVPFQGQSLFKAGEMVVIPLPFTTRFYGVDCDTISICSNGYICPGNQPRAINLQNWRLDRGIGGGVGMIAPFWDWLVFNNNSKVYSYYDEDGGRFIVEWSKMRHQSNAQTDLIFEVVLGDRDLYVNEHGDTDILFQYKSIADVAGSVAQDTDIPYASVGISSPTAQTGISYVYRNTYPVTSARLANQRALLFTSSIFKHNGVVYGHVYDAATHTPLLNATIGTAYGLTTFCDPNGFYMFDKAVIGTNFSLIASSEGYSDSIRSGLRIAQNDSLEVDFMLNTNPDVVPSAVKLPESFGMGVVYPNPFNSSTTIAFSLPTNANVSLQIYDLTGREVSTLLQGNLNAGEHQIVWSADGVRSGLYFARLKAGRQVAVRKVMIVR
jgi:hypothetical protein